MNKTEKIVFEQLRSEGYEVLDRGWPDLLAIKDGRVCAVEIKTGKDTVDPAQERCHAVLRSKGIDVDVVYVTKGTSPYMLSPPKPSLLSQEQIARHVDALLLRVCPDMLYERA